MIANIDPKILTGITAMFADNRKRRESRAAQAFRSFTADRQRLIKDAAVMGFVQGMRHAGMYDQPPPDDGEVLMRVLTGCLSMPDLYPGITRKGKL